MFCGTEIVVGEFMGRILETILTLISYTKIFIPNKFNCILCFVTEILFVAENVATELCTKRGQNDVSYLKFDTLNPLVLNFKICFSGCV